RDAGDRGWVLEREEEARACTLVDGHLEDVAAAVRHFTTRDLVARMAHDRERERALAGAVRAHDRVHFPTAHDEVDPLEDLFALYVDVKVFDDEIRQRSPSP